MAAATAAVDAVPCVSTVIAPARVCVCLHESTERVAFVTGCRSVEM